MSNAMQDMTLDVRGLEPPEPMERVLEALPTLAPGQRLCMVIGREPHPLYAILARNGYAYTTRCRDDHVYEVLIWKR
jgi:uncharacterized protein (DUF2249 family)